MNDFPFYYSPFAIEVAPYGLLVMRRVIGSSLA